MAQKDAFPYRASLSGPSCPAEQCLSFAATTFPTTFIPSLSWRIDRFKIETAQKRAVFRTCPAQNATSSATCTYVHLPAETRLF
jgi:hypothetical protein